MQRRERQFRKELLDSALIQTKPAPNGFSGSQRSLSGKSPIGIHEEKCGLFKWSSKRFTRMNPRTNTAILQSSNCSLKIMKPTIRMASIEEVDLVSDILCEAAKWLTEKGEPLWKAGELVAEKLSVDVSNGMFYIAWVGNDAAGVFKFQTEDKLFWPDVPVDESCFIHRVAVRRNYAGKGICSAMIDYAKAATEVIGRRFLRLDTDATRPKLRAVYE
jgi:Acetyltransferase (GNAT) family